MDNILDMVSWTINETVRILIQITTRQNNILLPNKHETLTQLKSEFAIVIFIHYNSRLVVDEDDLKWMANEKKILLLSKQFHENVLSKTPSFYGNNAFFRDASMHREGLTLSNLNLPWSSSSTTSRELPSQFWTCSGWRWSEVGEKLKKITMYWWTSFMEIFVLKPLVVGKLSLFSGM